MTFEVRKKLLALLDCAYNKNPKLDKYKRFYLELSSKLCNSDVYEFQKGNTSDKNKVIQMLGDYRIDTSCYNPTPEKTKISSDMEPIFQMLD